MEGMDARARAGLPVPFSKSSSQPSRRGAAESSSEDELLLGVKRKPVIATPAARSQFKPPMRSSSGIPPKRPKRTAPMFHDAASTSSRPKPSTASGASLIMSPSKRKTMEERKKLLQRAHSTKPLGSYQSSRGQPLSRLQKGAPPPRDLTPLGKKHFPPSATSLSINHPATGGRNTRTHSQNKNEDEEDIETEDELPARASQPFPLDTAGSSSRNGSSQGSITSTSKNKGKSSSQSTQLDQASVKRPLRKFPLSDDLATSTLTPVEPRAPRGFPISDMDAPKQAGMSSSQPRPNPLDDLLNGPRASPDHTPPKARAKPFPLGTPSKSSGSSGTKRESSASPTSSASPSQRMRLSHQYVLDEYYLEDDTIVVDTVDESTLCPFCDEPLPSRPSARLERLMDRARLNARPQPRIGNSKGLKAPFSTFIDACNQHRNEMTIIPQGVAQGWPTDVDFDGLPARLKTLRPRLLKLIEHPDRSDFFRETMESIAKAGGVLASAGAAAQLNAFQKSRPGYYGERGLVRITRLLNDLFPSPATLASSRDGIVSFAPLDPASFVSRVLVPECARLLIKDDLDLSSNEEALRVLFASQDFGSALYPDLGEDDDMDSIGVGLRVRLQKGRERHERHISEAERALGAGRMRKLDSSEDDDYDELVMLPRRQRDVPTPSTLAKGKGRAKPRSRAASVLSSRSSVIELSDEEEPQVYKDEVAALISSQDRTPKQKKKKIRLGNPNSHRYSAFTQSSISVASQQKGKRPEREGSVISINSDASSTRSKTKWASTIRGHVSSDSSDEL